jgi:hypothetical protein
MVFSIYRHTVKLPFGLIRFQCLRCLIKKKLELPAFGLSMVEKLNIENNSAYLFNQTKGSQLE